MGFARELYSSPRIQVDDDGYGNSGYRVSEIAYEGRKISHLVIVNKFGKEAFRWDLNCPQQHQSPQPTKDKKTILTDYCKTLTDGGANREEVVKFFKYFEKKCDTWSGNMDVQKLWTRWLQPKSVA